MKSFKAFRKPFEEAQRSVKIKILLNFFSSPRIIGTEGFKNQVNENGGLENQICSFRKVSFISFQFLELHREYLGNADIFEYLRMSENA